MNKAWVVGFAIALAVTGWGKTTDAVPPHRHQPNIIFILADDQGYSDLSC